MNNISGRFFVAIALPKSVKEGINQIQNGLAAQTDCYRWVQKDLLHLTLYFCGEQDRKVMNVFSSNLSQKVSTFDSFTITLGQLGAFPDTDNPRVLWVGISKGAEQLTKLHELVADTYHECLVSATDDKVRFHPHITLARRKESYSKKGSSLKPDNTPDIDHSHIPVESIFLMESTLTAKGPQYKTIQSFHLHRHL